jgi:GNAT superfamily N-acetyltransferase
MGPTDVTDAHARRLAAIDRLIPPPVTPTVGLLDVPLEVPGGTGHARVVRTDPDSGPACWGALIDHRLAAPRVESAEAMAALLDRWAAHVRDTPMPGETAATVTWPSRDVEMTRTFLDHGLSARTVIAARPAGRPVPAPVSGVAVRPVEPRDADAVTALWLAEVRWDAYFGGVTERAATGERLREQAAVVVDAERPCGWVAEVDGSVRGMVVIEWPAEAAWLANMVAVDRARMAYLSCMSVEPASRGHGVGATLAAFAHELIDRSEIDITLLHHAALNPLSAPFWSRCGYRPLWTAWEVRPHTAVRAGDGR